MAADLAADFPELTALIWMDNVGAFELEHYRDSELVLGLVSEGPRVDVYAGTLTGDYPQLRFRSRELRAMAAKPYEQLSELEREVVENSRNAVQIGLAELFPGDDLAFLSVGYEPKVHALVLDGEAVEPRLVDDGELPRWLDNLPDDWFGMPVDDPDERTPEDDARAAYAAACKLDAACAWAELVEATLEGLERHRSLHDLWLGRLERGYAGLGRLDEALSTIDRIMASPSLTAELRGLAYYNRACYLCRQGNLDPALEALERAIAIDPTHAADAPGDSDFAPLLSSPRFRALCGQ